MLGKKSQTLLPMPAPVSYTHLDVYKRQQQYYTQVQRDNSLSSNTMRRHHDLLSSSLRTAVRQDMLLVSPMDRVEPPRSKLYEADFYTPEELKRLYALLPRCV